MSEYDNENDSEVADAIRSVGRVQAICPPSLDAANFAEALVLIAAVFQNEIAPAIRSVANALERIAAAKET